MPHIHAYLSGLTPNVLPVPEYLYQLTADPGMYIFKRIRDNLGVLYRLAASAQHDLSPEAV